MATPHLFPALPVAPLPVPRQSGVIRWLRYLLMVVAMIFSTGIISIKVKAANYAHTDAKSMAMGATGVASGRSVQGLLHNPALLSMPHADDEGKFGLFLPSAAGRAVLQENLVEDIEALENEHRGFSATRTLQHLQAASDRDDVEGMRRILSNLTREAREADADLARLDKSRAAGIASVATAIARPDADFGIGLYAFSLAEFVAIGRYHDSPATLKLIDHAERILASDEPLETALTPQDPITRGLLAQALQERPEAEGEVAGFGLNEVGITVSRAFQVGSYRVAAGLTPKMQDLRSYYYFTDIESFDPRDLEKATEGEHSRRFNLDLGLAWQFGATDNWTAGLTARNLFRQSLPTATILDPAGRPRSRTLVLRPSLRVGLAWQQADWTGSLDFDLTRNRAFAFEGDRQEIGLGAAYDINSWCQLRGGVRHNLSRSGFDADIKLPPRTSFTAGIGITPGTFLLDLTAGVNADEYTLGVDLGLLY